MYVCMIMKRDDAVGSMRGLLVVQGKDLGVKVGSSVCLCVSLCFNNDNQTCIHT